MRRSSRSGVAGLLAREFWSGLRARLFPHSRSAMHAGIREAWRGSRPLFGRRSREARDLHDLTAAGPGRIDDTTWADLDLSLVFAELDTTATDVGQQYLYRMLRELVDDEASLRARHEVFETLRGDAPARETILTELFHLSSSDVRMATHLLFGEVPRPRYRRLFVLAWSAAVIALCATTFVLGGWLWYLAVLGLCANFVACQLFVAGTDRLSYAYHVLYQMLCVAERIAGNGSLGHLPPCAELASMRPAISRLRRRSRVLAFSQASPDMLIAQPMHLLNLLTAIEPVLYTFNAGRLDAGSDTLRGVHERLGALDAAIAVARYKDRHPAHCNPELTREGAIELRSAWHPLIPDAVANDFSAAGESALITGSNMAGKTSFIKMVGLNLVLARTLWICHAESARFPLLGLATSIRTRDAIVEGKSFHFAELERVLTFLADDAPPKLLLIDEMYRGTNTVERVAGAAAVLRVLARSNTVLVTTHDVELSRHLADCFVMFHFEETGELERPFDYRLKPGVCGTRNAIELMRKLGYPEGVVSDARGIATVMDAERRG